GVAEPAESPNALAAFVRQRVIDEEGDDTAGSEPSEDKEGDAVGQTLGCPGRALEEVVIAVKAVALAMVGWGLGGGAFGDVEEGMMSGTQDPGLQQFSGGR